MRISCVLYLRSPAQSYHWSPVSLDMLSCVRRRTHSSGVVWKNKTGSFRTLHHSQLISSDDWRQTFSMLLRSGPEDTFEPRVEIKNTIRAEEAPPDLTLTFITIALFTPLQLSAVMQKDVSKLTAMLNMRFYFPVTKTHKDHDKVMSLLCLNFTRFKKTRLGSYFSLVFLSFLDIFKTWKLREVWRS